MLVSGLIPEETIANAEAAMWSALGLDRDDPASWSPLPDETDGVTTIARQGVIEHFGVRDPALLACLYARVLRGAEPIGSGRMQMHFTVRSHNPRQCGHAVYFRFRKAGIISVDTSMVDIDLLMFFQGHFGVSSLTYLDSGVAQGGGDYGLARITPKAQ